MAHVLCHPICHACCLTCAPSHASSPGCTACRSPCSHQVALHAGQHGEQMVQPVRSLQAGMPKRVQLWGSAAANGVVGCPMNLGALSKAGVKLGMSSVTVLCSGAVWLWCKGLGSLIRAYQHRRHMGLAFFLCCCLAGRSRCSRSEF